MDFAILRSHFWYRLTVPKMGPWKCFSFVLLLSCACGPKNGTARRSHFWDRVQVHFLKFFVSGLQKRNVLVSMKLCGLWRPEGQLFQIYMLVALKLNPVVIFCLLQGSAFAVDFAILRSHFWYRQTVPKMGPWKCFSFVLLLSCACGPKNGTARRSHFWDRV